MKKFKPFDKVLVRGAKGEIWRPYIYSLYDEKNRIHILISALTIIDDRNIIPYNGNEHLIGTTNEHEEEITLAVGELILVSFSILALSEGCGVILNYKETNRYTIVATNGSCYDYFIPMSKYNPNNLEETRKWILTVKDGKLVKVNK